jgi:uncharacterized protein (TIGR00251 family)
VDDGSELQVWAKPRATHSEVLAVRNSVQGEALEIRLAAPPVEGAANTELLAVLARALAVPVRDLQLVQGAKGRLKRVRIQGLSPEEVRERLL